MNQSIETNEELLIDIEKVIASKNRSLLKLTPGPILSYLKHIIHQNEVNAIISANKNITGVEFAQNILKAFGVTYESIGLESIDRNKRYIFAANHPLGGMDGIAFLAAVSDHFSELKFPVNDILLNIKGLNSIFLPINKHGAHSRDAAINLEKAYRSEAQILMFPAGLVSRKQSGVIKDLEWKRNFIKKAISHERSIIPVHISGENSSFFYNLSIWRRRLGIKANIEMLYLVDEMFKQKNNKLTITFGSPIDFNRLKEDGTAEEWAQKIREIIYELPKKN